MVRSTSSLVSRSTSSTLACSAWAEASIRWAMATWMGTSSRRRSSSALRRVQLALRDIDLVLVMSWVDFGQHVALLYLLIFFDQEANDVAGHRLRRDVYDVRLDKGVVRFGHRETINSPNTKKAAHDQDQKKQSGRPEEPAKQGPRRADGSGRRRRRGRARFGHGLALRASRRGVNRSSFRLLQIGGQENSCGYGPVLQAVLSAWIESGVRLVPVA